MIDSTVRTAKRPAIMALGALTAGALAATAMGSVPTANATCASFFGIGSGGQCTSTLTSIAIAIGENAEAHANGILGAALTWGNSSHSTTFGLGNLAVSLGNSNFAGALGIASLAFAGRSTINQTVIAGEGDATSGNVGNIAVSVASPEATEVRATGIGNLAVNIAGAGSILSQGVGLTTVNLVGLNANLNNAGTLNAIANVSGDGISISNDEGDGGIGNLGFNFIGENNVIRTRGALALGGAIGSTGQTVSQEGVGVNIAFGRNAVAPGAAKLSPSAALAVTASAVTTDDTKSNRKARGAQTRANRSNR